jgi:hypothetical protein
LSTGSAVAGLATAALLAWGAPALADEADPPGSPDYFPFCQCERPGVPDGAQPNAVKAGGNVLEQFLARLGSVLSGRISLVDPAGLKNPNQ